MRAKLIILLLPLLTIYTCYAGTGITPKKAIVVAETYYRSTTNYPKAVGRILHTDKDNSGNVLYYIVNMDKSGFVIVSGTAVTHPIIAISTKGNYKTIPQSGVEDYLFNLHNHISTLYQINLGTQKSIISEWDNLSKGIPLNTSRSATGVGPLVTTTWNQSPYYNEYCPGGSVTGCVATAMAQIIKYWNYPASGTGSYSYTYAPYGTITSRFDTAISWGLMPVNLTSSAPQNDINAVAGLMYKLGVSVAMQYSPSGSGAYVLQSENPGGPCAQYSYVNYFGYNSSTIQGLVQANYTTVKWDSIINAELNNSRPIEYVGFGVDGGHTWVLDGYNSSGLYDMNWGWGGLDDGFYALNNLDPSGIPLGTNNAMLIGIQPASNQQTCGEPTSLVAGTVTTSTAVINWVGAGSPKSYNLNYQVSGASTWTSVTGITSPTYTLTGLTAGTTYNVEVQQVCTNSVTSGFTGVTSFATTSSTCGEPTSLATSSITTSSAFVSWLGVGSPKSYTLNYQVYGANTWTSVTGITSPNYTLTGLAAGTMYNVEVQQVCTNSQTSSFTNILTFITTQATCGQPTSLAASNVTTSGATITWVGVGTPQSYTLNYKIAGAASWTTISGITSSTYTLTGLATGTTYNMEVQQVCSNNQTSSFTNTVIFTTTQLTCSEPTTLAANSISDSSAVISWVGAGSPKSYTLNYQLSGASTWTSITGITAQSYTLSSLVANSAYNIQVQQVCTNSTTSSFTNTVAFSTLAKPWTYCSSSGTSSVEYVKTVKFGSINNTGNDDGGYHNYTSMSTNMKAGVNYQITLTPGFTNTTYTETWAVYIDYNHTGNFVLILERKGTGSVSGPVKVPGSSVNGNTRLRIVMHRNSYITNPCGTFTNGDVQDYNVLISGGSSSGMDLQPGEDSTITAVQDNGGIALNVYPNPTNGILNLKYLNDISVKDIALIDVTGKILMMSPVKLDALDLSKYAQGWYLLVITGSDGSVSRKPIMVTH